MPEGAEGLGGSEGEAREDSDEGGGLVVGDDPVSALFV